MRFRFPRAVALASAAVLITSCLPSASKVPGLAPPSAEGSDEIVLDPDHLSRGGRPAGYLRLLVPGPTRSVQSFPESTARFRLSVSASDLETPLTATLERAPAAASASVSIAVPPGEGRSLLVEALNVDGMAVASGSASGLTVTSGQFTAVSVTLQSVLGSLVGRVLNQETGQPEPGVTVTAGEAIAQTDASGSFRLSDLPPSVVTIAYRKLHFDEATESVAVLAGVGANLGSRSLQPQRWIEQVSGTSVNLTAIHVVSASEAWVCGGAGTLLHTTDGGTTWSKVPLSVSEALEGVAFADASTGYAVTEATLLRTTDGGATWQATPQAMPGRALAVFGAANVFTAGNIFLPSQGRWDRFFLASSDGGQTFVAKTVPDSVATLTGRSSASLFAAAPGVRKVFKSTSEGSAWSALDISPVTPWGPGHHMVAVASDGTCYVAGNRSDGGGFQGAVSMSEDGGATWHVVFSGPVESDPNVCFRGVAAVGAGACAVGTNGMAVMRRPGELAWKTVPIHASNPATVHLNAVSFLDANTGWAVGDGGRILRY